MSFLSLLTLVFAVIIAHGNSSLSANDPSLADVEVCRVPALKGSTPLEAAQRVRLAELSLMQGVFYLAPHNWRDDILPHTTYMQTPQPGALLPIGAPMAGWTFAKAGADQQIVTMPDLRGNPWQAARQRLAELKLPLLDDGSEAHPGDDAKVLDQYPKPGQSIYEGTSVYLVRCIR